MPSKNPDTELHNISEQDAYNQMFRFHQGELELKSTNLPGRKIFGVLLC